MPSTPDTILAALKTNRLPSLPHVLVDMLDACHGQNVSFQDMSQIIGRDAAITARVVALANSSYYNRGRRVDSLERALFMLGTNTIKTIVITASIQQFFSGFSSTHTAYLRQFWRQSLGCALMAKSLAILTSYADADEAYLTGLLHNIGELVLETNYGEAYQQLRDQADSSLAQVNAEHAQLGISHPQVGAWLLREWGISDFAADALAYHHTRLSDVSDAHHLVKIIYLAAQMSEDLHQIGESQHACAEALFDLNASLVNEIAGKIAVEVSEVAASLGIHFSPALQEEDHEKQIELARQVRNLGLVQSAAGEISRANTPQELNQAFQNTLELLFAYHRSLIFWLQPESEELVPISNDDTQQSLRIKLNNARSVIARAAQERRILAHANDASDDTLPVVDQQVMRLLHCQHLCCIPIATDNTLYCVLVVPQQQALKPLGPQHQLLNLFAHEIAINCEDTLARITQQEEHMRVQDLMQRVQEIAHEANNPLNIISNYLESLASKLAQQGETHEELLVLREEIERASSILFRLRDLQSPEDDETGCDVNREIEALSGLYQRSLFITRNIRCTVKLGENLGTCTVSRNALRQVLTNLIKNAVEAMPDGGGLNITTSHCVNAKGEDLVEIRVADTGPGMPDHILKNLFTPLTSTKGAGHSGLGLSITKNLVTDASGNISCRSNKQGTEFQILFPIKN